MSNIEIQLSKAKLVKLVFFSVLFLGASLWILIYQPKSNHFIFGNPYIMNTVSVLGILFGGMSLFFSIKKMGDKKPGIIIDTKGIIDNSSALSIGRIPWKDIDDIIERVDFNQKSIALIVKNPEEYIDKQTSFYKRRMMRANFKMSGSPIAISSNSLKTNLEELGNILTEKHTEYLNSKNLS
ncbi:STM3941 family protein [Flavobacterium oncorhynchi]|uniref:STM3941 family protein n=1 Tax=Flavobacterium oncorhynchi TaxID=728056 RepID=UPI00351AAB38